MFEALSLVLRLLRLVKFRLFKLFSILGRIPWALLLKLHFSSFVHIFKGSKPKVGDETKQLTVAPPPPPPLQHQPNPVSVSVPDSISATATTKSAVQPNDSRVDAKNQGSESVVAKPKTDDGDKVLGVVIEQKRKRKKPKNVVGAAIAQPQPQPQPQPQSPVTPITKLKKIGSYTSAETILLVGEGDFSFSASLAVAFASASNVIATSLNDQEFLKTNYANFPNNNRKLLSRGATVLHGIDATKMATLPQLLTIKFDRIVYNFPHSGFRPEESPQTEIGRHQRLVSGFLRNAKTMIKEDGQIHITHKSNGYFLKWNIPKLASDQGLSLIQAEDFNRTMYPGYHTKYGFGGDEDFDCEPSKTYKFGLTSKH